MSPGTICSAGISLTCPSRRTLDLTIIIFCKAATLSSALPSWRSASSALKSVSTTSSRAVPHCLINRLAMAATSKRICIGSWYWRRKARQPGSFCSAVNLLGPYCFKRLSTSAWLKPVSASTPCARKASSMLRVCHAGPCPGRLLTVEVDVVILFSLTL